MKTSKMSEAVEAKNRKPSLSPSNGKDRTQPAVHEVETSNGTFDLRQLLRALTAAREGNFNVRLPSDLAGVEGKIADVFNDLMAQQLNASRTNWNAWAALSAAKGKSASAPILARVAVRGARWRPLSIILFRTSYGP